MFDALKKRIEDKDRFAGMLGIKVLDAAPGYGKVSMPLLDSYRNPVGVLHGGAAFTLADVAFAVAANCNEEKVMVTTSSSISFIKTAKSGPITAECRLANGGKRMATFNANVFDGEGTLIATALFIGYRLDVPIVP